MWCFIFRSCHLLLTDFQPGLVAYTSAYPIICKKSWQRGAQPQLITTFINNSLHMFCPDLSVSNLILQIDTPPWYVNVGRHPRIRLAMACVSKRLGGVSSIKKLKYMCKQKRRGMIYLAGRNNVLHGSRSLKVWLTRGLECPLPFVDNNKHLLNTYFVLSICFQKPKKL